MTAAEAKFLLDPYLDWTKGEGIPIHEDFAVDLTTAATAPWPRLGDGCQGAFVHLTGRGDWMTVFLLEVPAGGKSAPQQHLFDEMFYVLAGAGRVVIDLPDGGTTAFDCGLRSLFAPPLNARYRIINESGREPLRLVCANALRILINLFHNPAFFFDNPYPFPERADFLTQDQGAMTSIRPEGNPWETNVVPDLGSFALKPSEARGAGSSNIQFELSGGSIGAHLSEIPAGTYKKAHRHAPGLHLFFIQGSGYTLLWYEGSRDFKRVDWHPGLCFAPPDRMFHQHFDTGASPARYLAVRFGTKRYPIVFERHAGSEGRRTDVRISDRGSQIEYSDQDPRIHALWLAELRKTGVQSQMQQ